MRDWTRADGRVIKRRRGILECGWILNFCGQVMMVVVMLMLVSLRWSDVQVWECVCAREEAVLLAVAVVLVRR